MLAQQSTEGIKSFMNSYDLKQEGYDLTTMMLFPGCEKKMSFTTDGYAKKEKQ